MGGGIDAERKSADYAKPGIAQGPRESFRGGHPLRCRIPAADHGERTLIQKIGSPFQIQKRRRVWNFEQSFRIGVVGESDNAVGRISEPFGQPRRRNESLGDPAGDRRSNDPGQRPIACRENQVWLAKSGQQLAVGVASQTRDRAQSNPASNLIVCIHFWIFLRCAPLPCMIRQDLGKFRITMRRPRSAFGVDRACFRPAPFAASPLGGGRAARV